MYTQPVAELTVNILLSQLAEVNKYLVFITKFQRSHPETLKVKIVTSEYYNH